MCLLIFLRFFQKYPFSEVSNIRWTSKIYSQRAEMFVYKIRESGDDRNTFSNFFWRLQKFCLTPIAQNRPFLQAFEIDKISKKIKKIDFFKMYEFFTPTMINENTQLDEVVSLLKGLERYFYAEDEKSIFYSKIFIPMDFYTAF